MLGCSCQLSSSIAQHFRTHSPPPRQRTAQLDGRAGEARPEGEKCRSGRRKACFHPGGSSFSLPRGMHAANFSALQFHPISFHAANRFFVSFLTQERNVPLVSSLPPHPQSSALLQGWRRALLYCFLFMHIRKARAAVYDVCRPMCTARYSIRAHRSIGPRPSRTTPRFCASTQISRSITVLARPITGRG